MTGEAWRQYLQTYVALRRAFGFTMQRKYASCRTSSSISNGAATTPRLRRLPSSGPRRVPKASTRGG